MRRLTVLLLALLAVLSLACGGEDRSAEIEQLQADVEALRAEVAYLSGELEIAQSERDRAEDELAQTLADLERQTAAAEAAAAAAAQDASDDTTDTAGATADAPDDADEPAPASGEFRAYFDQVEGISQGATAASAELVAKMDAAARTGDLEAMKALFGDLARLLDDAAAKAAGLEPPPALASLHAEFAAAQQGFAQAMADYARAVGNVTTWEAFAAVVEAFPQSPEFLAAAGRTVIACFALQEAGAKSGVTVELHCEGI